MFPGEGAGSQLRRRGESVGLEQGSSYVISNPANSWELQKSSPQGSPNPRGVTRASTEGAMACSSRDRTAEFRFSLPPFLLVFLHAVCFFSDATASKILIVTLRNTVRSLKGRNLNSNGHVGRSNGAVVATREASQLMDIARFSI